MRKLFLILLSVSLVFSCGKIPEPGPDDPGTGTEDPTPGPGPGPDTPTGLPAFSTWSIPDPFDVPFEGLLHLNYKGLKVGDEIRLTLRDNNSVSYTMKCTAADDEKGADFTVPSKFVGAVCRVNVDAGNRYLEKEVFVNIVDYTDIDKVPGRTTYGRVIDLDGKPIQGVSVSDGVLVTTTDSEGRYYLASMRKNGYVFISVPKDYRTSVNRTIPQFYQNFTSTSSSVYELHNFVLEAQPNSNFRMIVYTDTHLAARTNDLNQFKLFKNDLREQIGKAKSEGVALYALTLGDLAWDQFWYDNSFDLKSYREQMADLDLAVYNMPGNHDNDPYVSDDFLAENAFRKNLGPTYYSFNVGDAHFVMMDNTLFSNKGASQGVLGDVQDYKEGFTANQMKWLANDLAQVPAGSTVFFCNHIQYSNRASLKSDGSFTFVYSMPAEYRAELIDLFAPYDVHILSGHTHINYTNRFSAKLMEHNIAAVCGDWWWTGYYTSSKSHLCRDGAPSGYKIFDSRDGALSWVYKGYDRPADYQFRAYDLNNCLIDRATYCPKSNTKVSDAFFSEYVHGYDTARSDNHVLVNVFDYDDDWTVSIRENGKELTVKRVDTYDPLHIIHFNTRRMSTNSTSMTFPAVMTAHMFEATASSATTPLEITVTDASGRVYKETMTRPRKLLDMSKSSNY